MKIYTPADFTWGYELELADVPKDFDLPSKLGRWEYAECDIVNTLPPYRGIAADPLGINPPVGGEVNTIPTLTKEAQVARVVQILNLFKEAGHTPNASPSSPGHVHVRVIGLTEDIGALHRLALYIRDNQTVFVKTVYPYHDEPDMNGKARTYMKMDGGFLTPRWRCDNMARAVDFADFIHMHVAGIDGIRLGRPFRHSVNTYCLKHTNTVEFRCYRASVKEEEIAATFDATQEFMLRALNGGGPIAEWLDATRLPYPPMASGVECAELLNGLMATRHAHSKAHRKNRQLWEAT